LGISYDVPPSINKRKEEDVLLERTELIQNPLSVQTLFIDMIKSAEIEVLLLLPTVNAFLREQRLGIIQLLKQGATERAVIVKILVPADPLIKNNLGDMAAPEDKEGIERKKDIEFRSPSEFAVDTVTIVVVDKKESLVFEKKDDSKENFVEALGLATYSNSKPTVMAYFSIFESLWKQVALYEQLKTHDKMQNEFINIASHEMKTPTQSILGYAELLEDSCKKNEEVEAIKRNAVRLQKLATNLLDVTRIESQTLKLRKETVNINEKIANVKKDFENQSPRLRTVKILLVEPVENNPIYVLADRVRLYEVLANLLSNAIKFTQKGTISISADIIRSNINNNTDEVIIRIRDTGVGINPEIQPRLFTKFATRSDKGTGLGLFISKGIVEAHGGRIWAENNSDGKGATFSFTLPLSG
jgi:two-component system, OmpR family, sensor histidine kinase VicK